MVGRLLYKLDETRVSAKLPATSTLISAVNDVASGPRPAANPVAAQISALRHCSVVFDAGTTFVDVPLPEWLTGAVPKRQAQYRAGRYCARKALGSLLSPVRMWDVPRGEGGAPVWPAGVVGSITHTEGFASAVVAIHTDLMGIGIDTEAVMSFERARSVATAVAWPFELSNARQAGLDREQALTLIFSAKESVFKCLYPLIGVQFGFHDVRLVAIDVVTASFEARIVRTLSDRFVAGARLEGRFAVDSTMIHTALALRVEA